VQEIDRWRVTDSRKGRLEETKLQDEFQQDRDIAVTLPLLPITAELTREPGSGQMPVTHHTAATAEGSVPFPRR
jgi:hypothetical protein